VGELAHDVLQLNWLERDVARERDIQPASGCGRESVLSGWNDLAGGRAVGPGVCTAKKKLNVRNESRSPHVEAGTSEIAEGLELVRSVVVST
jgi:hypothetical protein